MVRPFKQCVIADLSREFAPKMIGTKRYTEIVGSFGSGRKAFQSAPKPVREDRWSVWK